MGVVSEFNGLNGKVVSRDGVVKMIADANQQEQPHLAKRLNSVLEQNEDQEFEFEIPVPAIEAAPQSIVECLECQDVDHEDSLTSHGLAGAVTPDEIYTYITNLMLNTIKKVGHLPWQKEWIGAGADREAKNYVTKIPYSGINYILLNFDIKHDEDGQPYLVPAKFKNPYYLTFKQLEAAGGTNKGATAYRAIYYTTIFDYRSETLSFRTSDKQKFKEFVESNNLTKADLAENLTEIPMVKYYNLFRTDDCKGLKFPKPTPPKKTVPIEEAQAIIDGFKNPPKYTFVGSSAYYQPSTDTINMPKIGAFAHEGAYYSTFFHEMIHSTGSKKRIDRDFKNKTSKKDYAFEELIAELGAVFLCAHSGILFHTRENSAKYLAGWNKRLISEMENDNRFFIKASAQAKKAANYILAGKSEKAVKSPKKLTQKPNKQTVTQTKIEFPEKEVKKNRIHKITSKAKARVEASKKAKSKKVGLSGANTIAEIPVVADIVQPNPTAVDQAQPETTVVEETPEVQPKTAALEQKNPSPISSNPRVQKIGTSVGDAQYFEINGALGKFLQRVEKKPFESVVITMDGDKGAGKTTALYQFMDAFASAGNKSLFISGEEHPNSTLAIEKTEKYISHAAKMNLDAIGHVQDKAELYSLIEDYDCIFIDSWQKLLRMVGSLRLDEDLRKRFDGKVFVIIFQQTTDGKTKGGAEVVFDADILIKMVKEPVFSDNYAYFDKHRYTLIPIEQLKYNIASGTVIYEAEEEAEPEVKPSTTAPQPINFSFQITEN